MKAALGLYHKLVAFVSGPRVDAAVLLFVRIVLAGVFWRSGRTKVEEGSWLTVSENTWFLFSEEYQGVPIPSDIAAVLATGAEHVLPILLVLGLLTRFSALALLGMTMVIQIFVYPDAWWPVHSLWVALALILIARGGGIVSLDRPLARRFLA